MECLVVEFTEVEKLFLDEFDCKLFGFYQFVNGYFVFPYAVETFNEKADFLNDLRQFG